MTNLIAEPFVPDARYRSTMEYLRSNQAGSNYRFAKALSLLGQARRAEPAERFRVVWDVATLLRDPFEARDTELNATPTPSASEAAKLRRLVQTLTTAPPEGAPTELLKTLVDVTEEAVSTAWDSYDAFERSPEGGGRQFNLIEQPELLPEYDRWFRNALPVIGLGLPGSSAEEAAAAVGQRIEFLLGKIADDEASDELGLRDRYERDAWLYVRGRWPWSQDDAG